ncbi:thiol:disulfide interchange protein DsbB [Sphaerotilus hippei]|uniref:Thiol:disulfide interchange protein DsbB n=1 Tax=Sphaerotilus hippei TaxID=744406 RepID=A0A318GY06_9BURK|nr:disulfide bond formation protein B [Sphaerotilus hippei]PXW94731.1 thiol:disulfide interchange protein DsbB [Sphaerotilus hippei]
MKGSPTAARAGFLALAAVSAAAVAAAVAAQHLLDMQPCPWCILQRVIFLAISLVAVIAALGIGARPSAWRRRLTGASAGVLAALSAAGVATAAYQHLVASKSSSCAMTLADRIVSGLGLDRWQPEVFEVRASCAEAAVSVLGVPFELWSLLLFVVLGSAGVMLALRAGRR